MLGIILQQGLYSFPGIVPNLIVLCRIYTQQIKQAAGKINLPDLTDLDAGQANEWAEKSVELDKRFWNLHTLARAQFAAGSHKTAINTAMESKEMSEKAGYEPYLKMNVELIEKIEKAMNNK